MTTDKTHAPIDLEQALPLTVQPKLSHNTFINLVEGDCVEKIPEIDPESVHLVVTDPPYYLDGLNAEWRKGKGNTPRGTGSVGGLPVGMKFDPRQGRALQGFIGQIGELLLPVMMPGAFAIVFSQPRLAHRMAAELEDAGFEICDLYAWHYTRRAQFKAFKMDHFIDRMDKSTTEKKRLKRKLRGRKTPQLRPLYEAMILAQKPRKGTFVDNWLAYRTGLIDSGATLDGKDSTTVMTFEKPDRGKGNNHLTLKPVLLIEHLIKLFSKRGQIVLDPFLGSGTTAVAALNTERACIGIEIEPDHIEIAARRIQEA